MPHGLTRYWRTAVFVLGLFVVAAAWSEPGGAVFTGRRPVLLRVVVVLTTASPSAELSLDNGTVVNAVVVAGDAVHVARIDNRLLFTHENGGSAEARIRLLVAGVSPNATARWHLNQGSPLPLRLEVYNENQLGRPQLVDRFDTSSVEAVFASPVNHLLSGGPLAIKAGPQRLVLAFFYPWAQHWNWTSDRLLDRPLFQYSTDLPDEVARSLQDASSAGINGVIVSWRGDTNWNDRRLQTVLDQAPRLGLRVSILVETLLARTLLSDGSHGDFDQAVMRQWLEKAFDVFAQQPAFLNVRSRPVVFVYVADAFTASEWRGIVRSLESSGRRMLLMADSLDPAFLDSFDGAFTYTTASVPQADLPRFYSDQALRTQSYDLVQGGERRVNAATVSPGYDDSLLGRDSTLVVDRANGGVYDAQWQAASAAQPDWVLVTSWNEFWENTHIEPSERYGHSYQTRTRGWSRSFRQFPR